MDTLEKFNAVQINIVNNSVSMAEELVSEYYKMSASQWLHRKYDVKTLADLRPDEMVRGPFAKVAARIRTLALPPTIFIRYVSKIMLFYPYSSNLLK